MNQWNDHTFVICAYGDSPFLEDCINSLLSQTVKVISFCILLPKCIYRKYLPKICHSV